MPSEAEKERPFAIPVLDVARDVANLKDFTNTDFTGRIQTVLFFIGKEIPYRQSSDHQSPLEALETLLSEKDFLHGDSTPIQEQQSSVILSLLLTDIENKQQLLVHEPHGVNIRQVSWQEFCESFLMKKEDKVVVNAFHDLRKKIDRNSPEYNAESERKVRSGLVAVLHKDLSYARWMPIRLKLDEQTRGRIPSGKRSDFITKWNILESVTSDAINRLVQLAVPAGGKIESR